MMKKIVMAVAILLVVGVATGIATRCLDKSRRTFNAFCGAIQRGGPNVVPLPEKEVQALLQARLTAASGVESPLA